MGLPYDQIILRLGWTNRCFLDSTAGVFITGGNAASCPAVRNDSVAGIHHSNFVSVSGHTQPKKVGDTDKILK